MNKVEKAQGHKNPPTEQMKRKVATPAQMFMNLLNLQKLKRINNPTPQALAGKCVTCNEPSTKKHHCRVCQQQTCDNVLTNEGARNYRERFQTGPAMKKPHCVSYLSFDIEHNPDFMHVMDEINKLGDHKTDPDGMYVCKFCRHWLEFGRELGDDRAFGDKEESSIEK